MTMHYLGRHDPQKLYLFAHMLYSLFARFLKYCRHSTHVHTAVWLCSSCNVITWVQLTELCVCCTVDVSCNFETSLCGWSSVNQLVHSLGAERADLQWTTVSSPVSAGPTADHSSTDASQWSAIHWQSDCWVGPCQESLMGPLFWNGHGLALMLVVVTISQWAIVWLFVISKLKEFGKCLKARNK